MIIDRTTLFAYINHADTSFSLLVNKACHQKLIKQLFSLVSRLGNGVFWYILILLIPFAYGIEMLHVSLQMMLTGLIGLAIYKLVKSKTTRLRPYNSHPEIILGTTPLDQYSFPSGHTLHAVGFSIIAIHYIPELSIILVPFTILTAFSRIVLGLHYPTDVIAGAFVGLSVSLSVITIFS